MRILKLHKLAYIILISTLFVTSLNGSEISLENKISSDNYNLYYNNYSLKLSNISSKFGNLTFEGFYDDYGLSSNFNGINTFSGNSFGTRLYLNNNWDNFYYQLGFGSDDFRNIEENLFYELAFAYLIPIDYKNSIILNAKLNRTRFQMNALSSYMGISNHTMNINTQFKISKVFIEAAYESNNLNGSNVPNNLLKNEGLINSIPENKLTTYYIYGYANLYEDVKAGFVYSASNSDVNLFQPTYLTDIQNFYTYFPYFTPVESKALSLLIIADQNLKLGSIDLGKISFKAQVPVISSTKLLYEVKVGQIAASDSVYYDYSGVEPLKVEIFWNKDIGTTGFSFVIGYSYFDKPYIKNSYFGDNLNGYINHQLTLKLIKAL